MPTLRDVGANRLVACHYPMVDSVAELNSMAPAAYAAGGGP
jgi:hypothetical protein